MDRLFNKAFKMPFTTDEVMHIFDANGQLILNTIKDLNKENMINLCERLNGYSDPAYSNDWQYRESDQVVTQNGREMYSIRGWGYLTGIGGLNLNEDEAKLIQDDLGEYVAERMRKI